MSSETKKKLMIVAFLSLFIITVSSRYNLNKKEVDFSTYHLNVESPKSYVLLQKDIVTYNKKEHSLKKINYIMSSNGNVLADSLKVYIPTNGELSDGDWILYNQGLKRLNCDSKNISKCMEDNILKTKGYILENNTKSYLLNKEFALDIYSVVEKYDIYLKNKNN